MNLSDILRKSSLDIIEKWAKTRISDFAEFFAYVWLDTR